VVFVLNGKYSDPVRVSGWITDNFNKFPLYVDNFGAESLKGYFLAYGIWDDFGIERKQYTKTNMVRYGNPGYWLKPKYVTGTWTANN
jgi:hypothetical protein